MNSNLSDALITKDDLELLRHELELLKSALYKTGNKNFDEVLHSEVRKWIVDALGDIQMLSTAEKEKQIDAILVELKKQKVMELTLAFEPTAANLEKIHNWLVDHEAAHVLLDVKVDPKLIGGAVIVMDGVYRDYSLKTKLDAVTKDSIQRQLQV